MLEENEEIYILGVYSMLEENEEIYILEGDA